MNYEYKPPVGKMLGRIKGKGKIVAIFKLSPTEEQGHQMAEGLNDPTGAFNAVISYMLGKGYMEEPLEFLRCWNQGDFDICRKDWPDAPPECYLGADQFAVEEGHENGDR